MKLYKISVQLKIKRSNVFIPAAKSTVFEESFISWILTYGNKHVLLRCQVIREHDGAPLYLSNSALFPSVFGTAMKLRHAIFRTFGRLETNDLLTRKQLAKEYFARVGRRREPVRVQLTRNTPTMWIKC